MVAFCMAAIHVVGVEKNEKGLRKRELKLVPARTFFDYERVREIRNQCRTFMTNDQRKIGFLEQVRYWIKKSFDQYTVVFLGVNECEKHIAYGLVYWDKDLQPWVTGGIAHAYRGLGYGRLLFTELCTDMHQPVYLEVLCDNIAAFNLYVSLGFKEISRRKKGFDDIITMRSDEWLGL